MICKICGNNVADGEKVCDFCGSPIKADSLNNDNTVEIDKQQTDSMDMLNIEDTFKVEKITYEEKRENDITEKSISQNEDMDMFPEVHAMSETKTASSKSERTRTGNNNVAIYVMLGTIVALICFIVVILIWPKGNKAVVNDSTGLIAGEQSEYKEVEYKELNNDLIDIGQIDSIIAMDANNADVSVCVADIKNDVIYATDNAEYSMSASALVNIPILYTVAKELENDNCSWNSQVNFQYKFAGRGTIKKEQDGNYFDLDYLVRQMLNYSDNNATNSLIDHLGRNYINNICNRNSFDSVDVQRYLGESSEYKDNYISAKDTTEMLAEIYTSTNDDINKDYLLSHFNIYDDARYNGVGRNLSSNVTFLNHNAVTSSIYNEIAIVVSNNAEYVITILCNNGQMATSADTVSRISDYVYRALSQ